MSTVDCGNVTVQSVFCDNVKVTRSGSGVGYVATFGFSDFSGLYGKLITEIERRHGRGPYVVDWNLFDVPCEALALDDNVTATVQLQPPKSSDKPLRCGRIPNVPLGDVSRYYPVFMSTVSVKFEEVKVHVEANCCVVRYKSFSAAIESDLLAWNRDPYEVYGNKGLCSPLVKEDYLLESQRDNLSSTGGC